MISSGLTTGSSTTSLLLISPGPVSWGPSTTSLRLISPGPPEWHTGVCVWVCDRLSLSVLKAVKMMRNNISAIRWQHKAANWRRMRATDTVCYNTDWVCFRVFELMTSTCPGQNVVEVKWQYHMLFTRFCDKWFVVWMTVSYEFVDRWCLSVT